MHQDTTGAAENRKTYDECPTALDKTESLHDLSEVFFTNQSMAAPLNDLAQ
jgi:hypothetical protein